MRWTAFYVLTSVLLLQTYSYAASGTHWPPLTVCTIWTRLLCICHQQDHGLTGVPRAFEAFNGLQQSQKELLQGCINSVPLADVHSTVDEHADHLGLHLRNTKYIAPKVRLMIGHAASARDRACAPALSSAMAISPVSTFLAASMLGTSN